MVAKVVVVVVVVVVDVDIVDVVVVDIVASVVVVFVVDATKLQKRETTEVGKSHLGCTSSVTTCLKDGYLFLEHVAAVAEKSKALVINPSRHLDSFCGS